MFGERVFGLPASRRVPRDHGELVREIIELPPPDPGITHRPVDEHQSLSRTGLLEGDADSVDLDPLHSPRNNGRSLGSFAAVPEHRSHPEEETPGWASLRDWRLKHYSLLPKALENRVIGEIR